MQCQILTNTVKDNDRVVYRETDEGQQRCEHGKADFPLKQREESQCDQNVVKHCDDGTSGISPIVPKGDEQQDANKSEQCSNNSLIPQLSPRDRADRVGSNDLVGGSLIIIKCRCSCGFRAKSIESLLYCRTTDVYLRGICGGGAWRL